MTKILFNICFLFILFSSCKGDKTQIYSESFYYWKTTFSLTDIEKKALQKNNINKLYVRFFDVALVKNKVQPVGKIIFNEIPSQEIVPVVFIKNDIFYDLNLSVKDLSQKIFNLIIQISEYNNISLNEIQIDCDWSEQTQNKYFDLLKELKFLHKKTISTTIRLHQVKYPNITGIPPADYGVLMYYNMGQITANDKNSIYDRDLAKKYVSYVKDYPLKLNTALPIFNWVIQTRNNNVIKIIPKVVISNIPNTKKLTNNSYKVIKDTYYNNYHLKENDVLKLEAVTKKQISEMIDDISIYSENATNQIIWYDLDEHNINWYKNENLFK